MSLAALAPVALPAAPKVRRASPSTRAVIATLSVAILARLATLAVPHVFFADEIFQYLEQAHRLVFGPGVVPWEYRYNIRSWVFPLLLAAPMRVGDMLAPDGAAYLILPKLALLGSSLAAIGAAWRLGRQTSYLHALFAALVAATWFEFVYFSTQALTEAFAVPLVLYGAALLASQDRRTLIAAGALLGGGVLLRFQYGPAIAVLAGAALRLDWRRLAPVIGGGLLALLAGAMVDLAIGQRPFAWVIENFHQNIGLARSHAWVAGADYYPIALAETWGVWLPPMLALTCLGARRQPALLACAAANLIAHSMVAHKEYRYILLTTMIVALLAGLGAAAGLLWLKRRMPGLRLTLLTPLAAGIWLAASGSTAAGPVARAWWTQGTPQLRAFAYLRDAAPLCGVAWTGLHWTRSGGYTYLHRQVPLFAYRPGEGAQMDRDAGQFDAIVTFGRPPLPAAFAQDRCFSSRFVDQPVCVARRAGPCAIPRSPAEINRLLVRLDQ